MSKIDDSEIQKIITGRIEPYIYSFATNTLPNLLKVGDTYRPVEERLNEWRRYYADLTEVSRHKAIVNENIFFRDHSVHKYLQQNGAVQVPIDPLANIHSREFFKDIGQPDLKSAIDDIIANYEIPNKYEYYNNNRVKTEQRWPRRAIFKPRPNQQEVINSFKNALIKGQSNLLMYAVMRFGKSIVSMWCAKEIDSKLTVVVSAKVDVKDEWKKTAESHKDFTGYRFMDSSDMKNGIKLDDVYNHSFKTGSGEEEVCANIVLFLSLQDLAGSNEAIKKHHSFLNHVNPDLLIIDETHFGARAQVLGKILAGVELSEEDQESLKDTSGIDDLGKVQGLKAINAKIKLHLSGTPYRILMGSEFEQDDIIAFVQFSDIYEAKMNWGANHLDENEWDNPYYGFPQMVRFAFNPNESSRKKLESIPGSKPSEIFAPVDTSKNGNYMTFTHEKEAIELLQVLDGTKQDTRLLGLLDHESIKTGKLARHVVVVLPKRASCDAFEKLIHERADLFKNLSTYKTLNISGHNATLKKPEQIKSAITDADDKGEKTLTLTVNRMLTGTTVPQWDTMIYFKATISPQEYDQAVFRLQSPWVKEYTADSGKVIKYDMKPQTLLVDLDPTRLFFLQEAKALSYGVNTSAIGNENIEQFIARELKVSPVLALNAENNKLVEINASEVIDAVRKYSSERSISEDVKEIAVDINLRDNQDIYNVISMLSELGSKNGLSISPSGDEEGQNLFTETDTVDEFDVNNDVSTNTSPRSEKSVDVAIKTFERQFRMYYVLILLFAFLSSTEEKSLADVVQNLEANDDNHRIARSLGLKKEHLVALRKNINWSALNTLDYKIQNSSFRASDEAISPMERISIAINKFGRLSAAEVFTPTKFVHRIYNSLGEEAFWSSVASSKFLDIASKSGSFASSFVERANQSGVPTNDIYNNFYSIPTSKVAYEFTRKTYELLGLNIDNIAQHFTSYDILDLKHPSAITVALRYKKLSEITKQDLEAASDKIESNEREGSDMRFSAIVGNPPYNVSDNTSGTGSAKPLYNLFMESSIALSPDYVSLITPSVWFTGGKGLTTFRRNMLNDSHFREFTIFTTPKDVFPREDLRGGINYFLWDANYDNTVNGVHVSQYEKSILIDERNRPFKIRGTDDIFISDNRAISMLESLFSKGVISSSLDADNMLTRHISSRNPFGINTQFRRSSDFHHNSVGLADPVKLYVKNGITGFISEDLIKKNGHWLASWKVITPFANNISTDRPDDNLNTLISEPGSVTTETYLVIGADLNLDIDSANNLSKYLKTKWTRALIGLAKANQNGTRGTYRFVPLQDFTNKSDIDWSLSIEEINRQLCAKYGLDESEKNFIETRVKAME